MISNLSFAATTVLATKTKTKKKKKNLKTNISLSYAISQMSNMDELIESDKVAQDIILNSLSSTISLNYKYSKKLKLKSTTKGALTRSNDIQKQGNTFTNRNNIDESIRSKNFDQGFSGRYKYDKKLALNLGLDFGISENYSIEQSFKDDKIQYHIIDDPYKKASMITGGRFKLNKSLSFNALYRFQQIDHTENHTFIANQGTNSRRIHSVGAQLSYRLKNKSKFLISAQQDETFYKDKVALLKDNTFQTDGTGKASTLKDRNIRLKYKFKKFSASIGYSNRDDITSGAESYDKYSIALDYGHSLGKNKISAKIGAASKSFKSQKDDNLSEKRNDESLNLRLELKRPLLSRVNMAAYIQRNNVNSNNVFGKVENNSLGLTLSSKF